MPIVYFSIGIYSRRQTAVLVLSESSCVFETTTEPEEALLAGSTLWRAFGGLPLFPMKSLANTD